MRRVVLVSPWFPPGSAAGVHRARHLAKHLPAHGWRPRVLTVDPRAYGAPPDADLARLVPERVEVRRVGAIPARLARLIGVGDISLRSYWPLRAALEGEIARERPGVVFFTGSPFYSMLLGRSVRRRHGVPVVLDFQDPWVSDEGARWPLWSKRGVVHGLACRLEPLALAAASAVTSVSETQNRQMRQRHPGLDTVPMAAIPIGGDPDDFEALRQRPPADAAHPLDPERINFVYAGSFMPRSGPPMAAVLRAAGRLAARRPDLARLLVLNFVGTANHPGASSPGPVERLARELGVAQLVRETPGRVPYLQALSLLARADGLLLVGSDEPHYTASKIYPGLMARRPFVSLFHAASSAHAILSAAGGGRSLAFGRREELPGLEVALADALEVMAGHPERLGTADASAYAPFTADAVAGRFADLFGRVAA